MIPLEPRFFCSSNDDLLAIHYYQIRTIKNTLRKTGETPPLEVVSVKTLPCTMRTLCTEGFCWAKSYCQIFVIHVFVLPAFQKCLVLGLLKNHFKSISMVCKPYTASKYPDKRIWHLQENFSEWNELVNFETSCTNF